MKRLLSTIAVICTICFYSSAQNSVCSSASLYCTGTTQNYPAGVNAGTAEIGANYGCVLTQPNPAWFYLLVNQPGTIELTMNSTPQHDIDFACWGPFSNPTTPCVAQLTAGSYTPNHTVPGPSTDYPTLNMIDCSYSTSWQEFCYIPNATIGQYYILMVTNYSNQPCNIIFSQTGGTGSLSCTSVVLPLAGLADTISICSNPATLTATTGYQHYHWSTGDTTQSISVTASGIYTITATLNGLPISDSVYVTLTQSYLNLNLGNDTTLCVNGSVTINAGSGFSQYLWSTGSTAQSIVVHNSGIFSVQTKDSGNCIYNDSKKVIINPSQSLNLGHDTTLCHYGPLILDAGNTFDTYLWSTGQITQTNSVNNSGTYSVTATNNQCATTVSDTISVLFNSLPTAYAGFDTSVCSGITVPLYGTGGPAYLWSPATNLSCTSCASPLASPLVTTIYTLTVTNSLGCSATDDVIINVANATILTTNSSCGLNNGTATVHHTGGSGNYTYVWNTSPAQFTQTAINLSPGNYSVTITDTIMNCTIIKTTSIINYSAPNVYVGTIVNTNCEMNNGSISANITNGATPFSFLWNSSPPQTTLNLMNVPNGYYCLTVTDANNCQAILCDSVMPIPYVAPEICMVTVDTSSNYNEVVWEKQATMGIDKYLILRESNTTGNYHMIGTRNYNDYSTFIDTTSNSLQQPYRYKLAIQDNCGLTSLPGNYHQTIHLSINAGMGGSWNLLWNNYEGFVFSTYNIYRGTNSGGLTLINSVSNTVNSYTDLMPPSDPVFYMIEAMSPSVCNPSAKTQGSYGSTISNLAKSGNIGIDENYNDKGILEIYPNPGNDILNISVSVKDYKNISVDILNLMGQSVLHQNIQHQLTKLDIRSLAKGIYQLKMKTVDKTETIKFVKE